MRKIAARRWTAIFALTMLTFEFQNCAAPNNIPASSESASTAPTTNTTNTPIYSTFPTARFTTSTANTWQYTGESISITVPPGRHAHYRVFLRQMASSTAAGAYVMYLSDAYAGPQGQPSHLGSPWQGLQADTWATLTSEGYLDLAPGTYTYYVLIYNATSGTLAVANSATDGAAYCTVIAWPL